MSKRLLHGVLFGTTASLVLGVGVVAAQAAPSRVSCPVVTPGSGTVTPAPAPGVDWSFCDLTGADLGGADLTSANLSHANLTSANLTKANTDQADFAHANLDDANGEGATLTNTNFTGADLTFFMADDLAGSDLQGVNITDANFSGSGVDFEHVRSGGVTGSTPYLPQLWTLFKGFLIGPGADFSGDDLTGWDFSNQNLSDTDLAGTNLTSANLTNVNLTGADVQGTIFKAVTWPGLESGDIIGAPASLPAHFTIVDAFIVGPAVNLPNANLTGANLSGTDLEGATFGSLRNANLTNADLTGAFLDGVDLNGVTWSNTICPDGTNSDDDFGTCVNNIDDRPPVANPTIDGLGGTNSWFIGPVTVVWHWTDGNATINPAKCPAQTTSSGQGPAVMVTATCFNALGAKGTASETFKIDTTPPQVLVTGVVKNHVYALGHGPKPGCRTTDAVSGVAIAAKLTITPPTGPNGTGKVTATCGGATDKAGNDAAPVSVSYTAGYGFIGFASPRPGSKLAKSAAAIIVTFRLADGRGRPVSASVAARLSGAHRVRVTLTGPGIGPVTATCRWDRATRYFKCSIKTPSAVRTGKPYRITAQENVGTGFVAAPAIGKARNPEIITFKTAPAEITATASVVSAASCPSVDPVTGAVTPAPVPGIDWDHCDLENANLAGADLTSADFFGADLKGANLAGATLKEIDLNSADLSNANLTGANLQEAMLSSAVMLTATLTGVSSGLISGTPASLPASWVIANNYLVGPGANLENANLTAAGLAGADLDNADLTDARLAQANLTGAALSGATLTGVISGMITGSPTLPTNWSLIHGYLVGPGANLSSADLTHQNLSGLMLTGADLGGAALTNANLRNADLENAILTGAILKSADLAGATLTGVTSAQVTGTPSALPAHWMLLGGYLLGPGADLTDANLASFALTGADLSGAELSGADLVDANLAGANLSGADLTTAAISNAVLTGANISDATLKTAQLDGTNLTNVNFDGADLTDASLADINLSGADLANTTLTGVGSAAITGTPTALPSGWLLRGGYLIGLDASLMDATLNNLDLNGANLTGATLVAASFEHTTLVNAILSGANLTSANLSFANLTSANLTNANLTSANFSFANLVLADLAGTTTTNASFPQVTWDDTTCPDGSNSNQYVDGCFTPLDTQAPVAHPAVSGTLGSRGWYRSSVTVTWNWTDDGTIDTTRCTTTSGSATNGTVKLEATCTDRAGNVGSGSENVKIDTTAPRVVLTGIRNGGVYRLGHVPAIACQTTDSVSGVAANAVLKVTTTGTGGVGSFTASCGGAVSVSGAPQSRPVSASYTVEYGFAGFIAPRPAATVAKSSHKIIVRFRLDNASGRPIASGLATMLARQHRVNVTLSGPRIKAVTALCGWDSTRREFACVLAIPAGVKTGSGTDYAITASEKLSAEFKLAPPAGAVANPEKIHFR